MRFRRDDVYDVYVPEFDGKSQRFGCREVSNMDPRTCEDPLSGDEEDDDREEHIVVDTSSNSQPVLKFEESAERDWSTLLAGTFLKRSNSDIYLIE